MTKVILERRRPRAARGAVRRYSSGNGSIVDGQVSEVFSRLGTAEGEIGQLREQFVGFASQMEHQGGQLKHIETQLAAIAGSVQARSVTDWKSLAAWATVILAVVALYTNLNLQPLRDGISEGKAERNGIRLEMRELTTAQNQTVTSLIDAAERRGRAFERMDHLEKRVDKIEQ